MGIYGLIKMAMNHYHHFVHHDLISPFTPKECISQILEKVEVTFCQIFFEPNDLEGTLGYIAVNIHRDICNILISFNSRDLSIKFLNP